MTHLLVISSFCGVRYEVAFIFILFHTLPIPDFDRSNVKGWSLGNGISSCELRCLKWPGQPSSFLPHPSLSYSLAYSLSHASKPPAK